MCMSSPDVPSPAEHQAAKSPTDPVRARSNDEEQRRRGMLATILTSSAGATGGLATTADPTGLKRQLG